jgi:hypothetical protein
MNFLRPILGRLVGSVVGGAAAWAAGRWGTSIDPGTQQQISDGLVAIMLAVFGVVYSLTHKAVSSKINPGDTATPKLAEQSKIDQARPGIR